MDFAKRTGCVTVSHANSILGEGGEASRVFPYRVPLWQLRRMIAVELIPQGSDFFVEYTHSSAVGGAPSNASTTAQKNGRRRETLRSSARRRRFEYKGGKALLGSDEALAAPPPWLLQKVVSFKSVLVDDHECGVCHGP